MELATRIAQFAFIVALPLVVVAGAVASLFAVGALFDALDDPQGLRTRVESAFRGALAPARKVKPGHYYQPHWLAVLAIVLSAARPALAAKPEPPLSVALRVLSSDPARGRHTVELRLRTDVALTDATLTVAVRRVPELAAQAGLGALASSTVEPLSLARGREVRRQLEVLTGAHEPVMVLVGLGGRLGGSRLHRTSAIDLGPPAEPPAGRVRTDQQGREYFEVPMRPPQERP